MSPPATTQSHFGETHREKKIVDRLKPDFEEISRLKESFEKMILNDSPLLQIILIDGQAPPTIVEFLYSPNHILEEDR